MHLDYQDQDHFSVYLNNAYLKLHDYENKDSIAKDMKSLVLHLNNRYHLDLRGFYRVIIHLNKKVGMFLDVEKVDTFDLDATTLDFKIIIYLKQPFYLKIEDYELIPQDSSAIFYEDYYYIDVDHLEEERLIYLLEMGTLIYGNEVKEIQRKGRILPKKKVRDETSYLFNTSL